VESLSLLTPSKPMLLQYPPLTAFTGWLNLYEYRCKNRAFASRNNKRHPYLLRALVSCGRCELACSARALRNSRYYVCAGKKRRARTRPRRELPLPLRPGGATRRSGLEGPLRGPHPPRVHHRSPATGPRRRLAAAGAQGPSEEPRRGPGRPEASAGEAHRGLPRGGDPAGRVPQTPRRTGA
jgi:hypothetical protein